jgi:hypothetical protein
MKTIDKVSQEIQTAKEKYGPFNSTHEVYGVLRSTGRLIQLMKFMGY